MDGVFTVPLVVGLLVGVGVVGISGSMVAGLVSAFITFVILLSLILLGKKEGAY